PAPASSGTAAGTVRSPRMSTSTASPAADLGAPTVRADLPTRNALPPWMGRTTIALVLIVLALLPFVLAPYPLGLVSRALSFALLVVSVDLPTGVMGMPSLGQVAYFGAGAYAAGLVGIHWTTNAFVQLGVGILTGALLAA